MALIKPEQLRSGSYNITGSLFGTASFAVTASYALTSPAQSDKITTGSITASVNIGNDIFLIKSSSATFFTINNQGSTVISSSADNLFLIKNQNATPLFTVSQSGIIVFSTQSYELTGSAPNGGMYFTSGSFFVGLD